MDGFKVPQHISQDLLLISEFVDVPAPAPTLAQMREELVAKTGKREQEEEDIDSTDSEGGSEDEIAADLIVLAADEDDLAMGAGKPTEPLHSSSDSSDSSDSDSEPEYNPRKPRDRDLLLDPEDDEDPLPPGTSSTTYFQTKHELTEDAAPVPIPPVFEVGADELLEKVGEVMCVVSERVVIVKGLPSEDVNRGSDRALDSDTLLVFGDRKVMGYVYETFGPTTQPLYQVKFSAAYPLDPEAVTVGREVFHVPVRSRFVFLREIKAFRGSDASNVHDEEPGDEELEFSDDEKEAEWRSRLKRKRGESRARSQASSREPTPNPSQMRDQQLADADAEAAILSRNAYDEHGPYDIDFSAAGPSRPAPIPYDDPYGDEYTAVAEEVRAEERGAGGGERGFEGHASGSGEGRGRGYERGYERDRGESQGRGRGRGGRGRERGERGGRDRERRGRGGGGRGGGGGGRDGGRDGGGRRGSQQFGGSGSGGGGGSMEGVDSYEPHNNNNTNMSTASTRPLSPTSLAIARATGQAPYLQNLNLPHQTQNQNSFSTVVSAPNAQAWGYAQASHPGQYGQYNAYAQMQMQQPYQNQQHQNQHQHQNQNQQQQHSQQQAYMQMQPPVQPHINPLFASAFGMAMNNMQMGGMQQQQSYAPPSTGAADPGSGSNWTDEWTVPSSGPGPGPGPVDGSGGGGEGESKNSSGV
ncbi:Gar1/Naf1 RNA binding region-domain-containing protein [Crassisporium funariophilum]|nr:Gar1/Naf1 RNA binding region-domain-containing protein [Crassisporium funariophilum]